jgi:hypothetical protein
VVAAAALFAGWLASMDRADERARARAQIVRSPSANAIVDAS